MSRTPELTHGPAIQWLIERGAVVAFGKKDGCNHVVVTIPTPGAHVPKMIFEGYEFLDLVARAMLALKRRQPRVDEKVMVLDQLGQWLKEQTR